MHVDRLKEGRKRLMAQLHDSNFHTLYMYVGISIA